MANYAFIDVQNTDSTTKQILGFEIDWIKLFIFLKNCKKCDKVFFYTGIATNDFDMLNILKQLKDIGCINREKIVHIYKNLDKNVEIICSKCGNKFIKRIDMGYNHKSNCDVDLTVDAMQFLEKDNVYYLFTGDGDFEYLINTAVKFNTKVVIVSNGSKIIDGPRHYSSRLSIKLRKLIKDYRGQVDFENIDNYRLRIEKTI